MADLSNSTIVHQKRGDVEYLQFRKLLEYEDVLTHCYTLKAGELDFRKQNKERLNQSCQKICQILKIDKTRIVIPEQRHTNNVKLIKTLAQGPSLWEEPFGQTDGILTNQKNIILTTTSSDCTNILLFDPIKKVIGSIHSGWRGTFQKIGKIAVEKMKEEYHCNPKDILCFLCPTIRKCHFEVHCDVKEPCEKIFSYTGQINHIITPIGQVEGREKWTIDTVLINKLLLMEAGVKTENIYDSGICSVCHKDKMHSLRGENGVLQGLNAAMIVLK